MIRKLVCTLIAVTATIGFVAAYEGDAILKKEVPKVVGDHFPRGEPRFDAVILVEARPPDLSLLYVVVTQPRADNDKLSEVVVRHARVALAAASEHRFEGTTDGDARPRYKGNVVFLVRDSRDDRRGYTTGFSVEQLREIVAANPAAGRKLVDRHAWSTEEIPRLQAKGAAPAEPKGKTGEPTPPSSAHKASDVVLIAQWLRGNDPTRAFPEAFGDSKCLTGGEDSLLYTDIPGVKVPAGMKAVNYEFVQARMQRVKHGHKAAPAVLIVRSSLDEPAENEVRNEVRRHKDEPAGRVYYVEVAIGNLAWHWLKVVVREGETPKAGIHWHKVS
jgi:hypothetical protein